MRRILVSAAVLLVAATFVVIAGGASSGGSAQGTYRIEFGNAFGLVQGADFKVAGVRAGKISKIDLCFSNSNAHCQNQLDALVSVNVTEAGFGSFRSDAFCQSRPQSLIGEYFIDCEPGQKGSTLKPGSTIPVSRTESTVPADLVQNVMRMPYRQRFTLIINELGAAVASRSEDLQSALRRAVPALTETDNLLNLLANDSHTIQQLNVNANSVISALAQNNTQVTRFITEANNAASDTASQAQPFQRTWHDLPGFLEQLRPALRDLGQAADAQYPVLQNLNAATGHLFASTGGPDLLKSFFVNLAKFSHGTKVSLPSLGQASVTGKSAVNAAKPTIKDLNNFAQPTPELANNLRTVLQSIDSRKNAVEADRRSPQGKGYTGLEALLQYVFNQPLAINTFSTFGHMLTVDAFYSSACSPYATQQTLASNFKSYSQGQSPTNPRNCYSWLGPNQPGINTTDPSAPGACVPDPGGAPPGKPGASNGACRLSASDVSSSNNSARSAATGTAASATTASATGAPSSGGASTASSAGSGGSTAAPSGGGQAQQLLNYLLAP